MCNNCNENYTITRVICPNLFLIKHSCQTFDNPICRFWIDVIDSFNWSKWFVANTTSSDTPSFIDVHTVAYFDVDPGFDWGDLIRVFTSVCSLSFYIETKILCVANHSYMGLICAELFWNLNFNWAVVDKNNIKFSRNCPTSYMFTKNLTFVKNRRKNYKPTAIYFMAGTCTEILSNFEGVKNSNLDSWGQSKWLSFQSIYQEWKTTKYE